MFDLFAEAVNAASPNNMLPQTLAVDGDILTVMGKRYSLGKEQGIYVFGSGKASVRAAMAVEEILGDRIAGGLVISNYDEGPLEKIKVFVSTHPVPDGRSIEAAELMMAALSGLSRDDVFIYLLSGGSSSLLEKPIPPLTLHDLQEMSNMLIQGGLTIEEMNVVRKHLSLVKGGKLAKLTEARGVVLVISDVIGDDLETIGSAPLYYDRSTFHDAFAILSRDGLWEALPVSVRSLLEQGLAGDLEETPKSMPPHIDHFIIGSNIESLRKAKEKADIMGIKTHIISSRLRGEAREIARAIVSIGEEIIITANPFTSPVCLLFGGETTVTVRGQGKGGRNQEMCLAALKEIRNRKGLLFLSAGTDGIDGNSDAAGAVVDYQSYERLLELGLNMDEYLNRSDSNGLFKQTGDLIITGPTGTNVMDITMLFIQGENP
jgi:glycerate 2-kinase